ncbi:MAG: CPBP family intramembrane glutamic endopeptidase [Parachlamydiaceae bacterium]
MNTEINGTHGVPDISRRIATSAPAVLGTGAFLGVSANWLGRTIVNLTGLPDRISNGRFLTLLFRTSELIATPIRLAHSVTVGAHRLPEGLFSNILAPILEEAVYRLGVQGGVKLALTTIGFPSEHAEIVANLAASVLFGVAHSSAFDKEFATATICGFAFGHIQEHYGFPEAVVAHAFNNIVIDLLDSFNHH